MTAAARPAEADPAGPAPRAQARPLPDPRGPVLTPRTGGVLIGLGALVVVTLWAAGLAEAPPGMLRAASRLAGLLAASLMVVLMCLVARIPAVERGLGSDRVARWHARLGRAVALAVMVHVAAVVAQVHHRGGQSRELADAGRVLAVLAVVLLTVVAVASVAPIRRRLTYARWHLVHLAGYGVFALTFVHVLTAPPDLTGRPAAAVVWSAAWGAAAVALLHQRLVRPLVMARRHRFRVSDVVPAAPGVVSISVTGERLERLAVSSGQFFRWRFAAPGLRWWAHPYSLSAPPTTAGLRFTAGEVGVSSRLLRELRPGTRAVLEGPGGGLTASRLPGPRVLLLASGTGIAPLRALAQTLAENGREVTVVHRARTHPVLSEELGALAERLPIRVHLMCGPRHDPTNQITPELIARLEPRIAHCDVAICGSASFAAAARRAVLAAGAAPARVHQEAFGW